MYINDKIIPVIVVLLLFCIGAYYYTITPEISIPLVPVDNRSSKINYNWIDSDLNDNIAYDNIEITNSVYLSKHDKVFIFITVCDFNDTNFWEINKKQEIQDYQNTSYNVVIDFTCYVTETQEFQMRFNNILSMLNLSQNNIYLISYQDYEFDNLTYLRFPRWVIKESTEI